MYLLSTNFITYWKKIISFWSENYNIGFRIKCFTNILFKTIICYKYLHHCSQWIQIKHNYLFMMNQHLFTLYKFDNVKTSSISFWLENCHIGFRIPCCTNILFTIKLVTDHETYSYSKKACGFHARIVSYKPFSVSGKTCNVSGKACKAFWAKRARNVWNVSSDFFQDISHLLFPFKMTSRFIYNLNFSTVCNYHSNIR